MGRARRGATARRGGARRSRGAAPSRGRRRAGGRRGCCPRCDSEAVDEIIQKLAGGLVRRPTGVGKCRRCRTAFDLRTGKIITVASTILWCVVILVIGVAFLALILMAEAKSNKKKRRKRMGKVPVSAPALVEDLARHV